LFYNVYQNALNAFSVLTANFLPSLRKYYIRTQQAKSALTAGAFGSFSARLAFLCAFAIGFAKESYPGIAALPL
jgi:hypothetical protein